MLKVETYFISKNHKRIKQRILLSTFQRQVHCLIWTAHKLKSVPVGSEKRELKQSFYRLIEI